MVGLNYFLMLYYTRIFYFSQLLYMFARHLLFLCIIQPQVLQCIWSRNYLNASEDRGHKTYIYIKSCNASLFCNLIVHSVGGVCLAKGGRASCLRAYLGSCVWWWRLSSCCVPVWDRVWAKLMHSIKY